jgi:O-antigen ligase
MNENTYGSLRAVDYPLRIADSPMKRHFFLEKKRHFYLTLAVIATTLFSWFNINSYLIILLLLCRLLDGRPADNLKTAFSNKYFLAYFSIFLLDFIGLFYTHHLYTGWKHMESKATLVAIPFIICSGPFTDSAGYRRLLSAYCLLLAVICGYCLSMAVIEYRWQHTISVFFYHDLTSALSVNAVFFSGYVIVALLFLLFSSLSLPLLSPAGTSKLRNGLIFFFTGIMFLLSSKLLLVLLAVIFLFYLSRNRPRLPKRQFAGLALLILIGVLTLALTRNPVSRRYEETLSHWSGKIYTEYNGINLRLLQWKFAYEILNENHAWAFGVSAGDSQDLLDQKYLAAGMSQGYLRYNFHNEYIEVLVRSGLVGSFVFLLAITGLIGLARSAASVEAAFIVTLALLVMLTESALEMQHTLFLFSFFPLLTASQSSYSLKASRSPRSSSGQ